MGPGQNFLTQVGSFFGLVLVRSAIYGLGLENFPQSANFSILITSGRKISLGRVKKYPGRILFAAGQKYAWGWVVAHHYQK